MDRSEVLERLDAAASDRGPIEYELVHVDLLRAAAELIRAGGWRPIAEAPVEKELIVGEWINGNWCIAEGFDKRAAIATGKTHYLPEPAPPAREVENG